MSSTRDVVHELEERLSCLGPDERGSRAEVDVLNLLAWALVPVDHRRATEIFDRTRRLSETLDYELGWARAVLGAAFDDFFKPERRSTATTDASPSRAS